jgi:hypothetical protein
LLRHIRRTEKEFQAWRYHPPGDAVAARGGIGIANRLLADHYREGDRKVALSGVPGGPAQAALDDQNCLSRALVQELQRKAAQPLIDSAVGAREPSAE